MIILLTGQPGVGKSTVIDRFIKILSEPASWVVTKGIPRPDGGRAGFEAHNSDGTVKVISHKTDIASDAVVGENHVDLAAVDAMFSAALAGALEGQLTIVDEIGPIQLLSADFNSTLEQVFAGTPDLVATIHYQDARLETYRRSPVTLLLEVTPQNRDMLPEALQLMVGHRQAYNQLATDQRTAADALLYRYAGAAQLMQIKKLMENALDYVHEGRVKTMQPGHWTVSGRHGQYHVRRQANDFSCECDLFQGRGEYQGQAGVCSHIQAVLVGGPNA